MATGERVDPYRNFNFLVEIDGITQAGFSDCTGIGASTDPIEYREGGHEMTRAQAARSDKVQQHRVEVGPNRFARALRLVPRCNQRKDRAQKRQHHPRRSGG